MKKQTVLIVDDQPTNVQALAALLKNDYRVLVANCGERALQVAKGENPPDLILLDIQMPGMDGYEICGDLKADPITSRIPVIFVTAKDSVEDEAKGFDVGAVDYISKPYHPAIVRARVQTHMTLKLKTDLLEEIALLDGLTGIPNRRNFDQALEREQGSALRRRQPLSVVMMDIDHFKGYNDHYGHGAGDACLKRVAAALGRSVERSTDMVARYGGEEFVALLPDTDAKGAKAVADRFGASVKALAITHEYSSAADVVTLSLGVATCDPATEPEAMEQLLKRADEALYRAKTLGRDRCVAAEGVN